MALMCMYARYIHLGDLYVFLRSEIKYLHPTLQYKNPITMSLFNISTIAIDMQFT